MHEARARATPAVSIIMSPIIDVSLGPPSIAATMYPDQICTCMPSEHHMMTGAPHTVSLLSTCTHLHARYSATRCMPQQAHA